MYFGRLCLCHIENARGFFEWDFPQHSLHEVTHIYSYSLQTCTNNDSLAMLMDAHHHICLPLQSLLCQRHLNTFPVCVLARMLSVYGQSSLLVI